MSLHFPDMPPLFRVDQWAGDVMVVRMTHYFRCLTSLGWVTVPTGFLSDGLSIPRWAWPIVGPSTGKGFAAGLLHDFLYSKYSDHHFKVSRKEADDLFLESLYHLGISWPQRHAMHLAVRAAGWRSWKKK